MSTHRQTCQVSIIWGKEGREGDKDGGKGGGGEGERREVEREREKGGKGTKTKDYQFRLSHIQVLPPQLRGIFRERTSEIGWGDAGGYLQRLGVIIGPGPIALSPYIA